MKNVEQLLASIESNTKQYSDAIRDLGRQYDSRGPTAGLRRAGLDKKKELEVTKELLREHDKLADAIRNYRAQVSTNRSQESSEFKKYFERIEKSYTQLKVSGQVSTELEHLYQRAQQAQAQMGTNANYVEVVNHHIKQMTGELERSTKSVSKANKSRLREMQVIEKHIKTYDNMVDTIRKYTMLSTGIGLITKGLSDLDKEIEMAGSHQMLMVNAATGLTQGFQNTAQKLGMSSIDLMEMYSTHRQVLLSSAGEYTNMRGAVNQTTRHLDVMNNQARQYTGNISDANKRVMETLNMVKMAGVTTNLEEFSSKFMGPKGLNKQMGQLQVLTGLTGESLNVMLTGYMQDSSVREQLSRMNNKQRMAFVRHTESVMTSHATMGKFAEASLAAQKSLAGFMGLDPRERYKSAVKTSAMMGSMGIQGGEELVRMMMKPMNMWGKEERTRFQQISNDVYGAFQQSMGSENFGVQATTAARIQAMGPMHGLMGEVSTILDESRALTAEQKSGLGQGKPVEAFEKTVTEIKDLKDTVSVWINDPSIKVMGGTLITIANILKGIAATRGAGAGATGLSAAIGGAMGGAAGKIAKGGAFLKGLPWGTILKGAKAATAVGAIYTGTKGIADLAASGGTSSGLHDSLPNGIQEGLIGVFENISDLFGGEAAANRKIVNELENGNSGLIERTDATNENIVKLYEEAERNRNVLEKIYGEQKTTADNTAETAKQTAEANKKMEETPTGARVVFQHAPGTPRSM